MRQSYHGMQGATLGPHQLTVPGRHEAEALTDRCTRPGCGEPMKPTVPGQQYHPLCEPEENP